MDDFNICMDRPDDPNTIIFNDLLHSFNLRNKISFQTHISGHTLDLILDEQNESLVKCVKKVTPLQITVWLQVTICMEKCDPFEKSVTYRKLKNINETDIRTNLNDCLTEWNTHDDLEAKIECYNNVILSLWKNMLPPRKPKVVKVTHKQLWFSDEIKTEIRLRCRKESICNKDPNECTYQSFYN